ncbi:hypothetical protein UlMin_011798 [Ulmus minor]
MVLIMNYCSSKVNLYSSRKTIFPFHSPFQRKIGIKSQSLFFNLPSRNSPRRPSPSSRLPDQTSISIYHPSSPQLTESNTHSPIFTHRRRSIAAPRPLLRSSVIAWWVSEEYKLGPYTLYLTVDMIDRFLSFIYIEKQRLQLLGVDCMLIASKYEEICTPRVEDFCFITNNTYSREEVIKMESEVLNLLHFQLSIPTIETFLRRFIQAAQSSNKVPYVQLEFLANYLAEFTLVDYSFLNFLPSLVAASAVFLARWTLSQSYHPWDYTLEHYTSYKASQLKTTVIVMEDLQRNTNGCSLNAIREKYKQLKFQRVATLTSKQPVVSLF